MEEGTKEGRKGGKKEAARKTSIGHRGDHRYITANVLKEQVKLESQAREENFLFVDCCHVSLMQCSVTFSSSKAVLKSE
jgi:hypothetical protein